MSPIAGILKFGRHGLATFVLSMALVSALPIDAQAERKSPIIYVEADHAKIQRLSQPAAAVIVGNPFVADVNVQGGRLLVITGKNYGTTNLIVLDSKGQEIANYKITVKTNGARKVTLHKGVQRHSLSCAPRCERELLVGDGAAEFKKIHKQIGDKSKLIKDGNQAPADR
jgi:hypothetical protein